MATSSGHSGRGNGDSLRGYSLLFDGSVEQRSSVASSSVGLILSLRDGDAVEQLLKDTERFCGLLHGGRWEGTYGFDGRHFDYWRAGINLVVVNGYRGECGLQEDVTENGLWGILRSGKARGTASRAL